MGLESGGDVLGFAESAWTMSPGLHKLTISDPPVERHMRPIGSLGNSTWLWIAAGGPRLGPSPIHPGPDPWRVTHLIFNSYNGQRDQRTLCR